MIRAAEINENGIVLRVINADSLQWCCETLGGVWLETSEDKQFRKNLAGIGFVYDTSKDAFIPPQPFQSWVLNETTCQWKAPKPMPSGGPWSWDETIGEWMLVS